jgi:hypothetical protein
MNRTCNGPRKNKANCPKRGTEAGSRLRISDCGLGTHLRRDVWTYAGRLYKQTHFPAGPGYRVAWYSPRRELLFPGCFTVLSCRPSAPGHGDSAKRNRAGPDAQRRCGPCGRRKGRQHVTSP